MPGPVRRPDRRRGQRRGGRGFTLLEAMVAIAVVAVLATLALPSMGRQIDRHRLQAAAEAFAADLAEARFEAVRRRQPLHVEPRPGDADWCWAVTTASGCGCEGPPSCRLVRTEAAEFRAVRLEAAQSVRFDAEGRADAGIAARLESGGARLHVSVGALGRARVCSPDGALPGHGRC